MMSTLERRPRAHAAPPPDRWLRGLDAELRALAMLQQAEAEAAHNQAQAAALSKAARAEMHYRTLGMDVAGIAAFHRTLASEDAAARMALRQATVPPARQFDALGRGDDREWIAGSEHGRCPHPIRLESDHVLRRSASARGTGTGWFGSGTEQACHTDFWHFPWTPAVSGWYTFRPVVTFSGLYIVQAAHDFWTSKEARAAIRFTLHHWQGVWKVPARPDPPGAAGTLWERGGTNVSECVGMNWEHVPSGPGIRTVPFTAGEPALISVQLTLHATARGEGSFAEVGAAGEGGALACRSLLGAYTLGR
ncbi:MAG TPA: hypothetical protein VGC13_04805 [Longimicrobium sp.]|jgi:hypothetical protein|uniref:hypothetical protein n=1 Tax=Longimicrobium sp. TaxID=2029185 RepID=UPI002ED90B72